MLHHLRADLVGHGFIHVQAHVRQFQTDIGVQALGVHLIEQLVVELRAVPGFFGGGHVFTQVVHAYAQAKLVGGAGGGQSVVERGAGNKGAGDPLSGPGLFSSGAQRLTFRKGNERGP